MPDEDEVSIRKPFRAWEMEMQPEEEIVISGMSGRFPESDNMYELHQNLMNKVDCITDDNRRWDLGKVKKIM